MNAVEERIERREEHSARRQRMLLVSYHFPPDTAVGGLRAANLARTLPGFGIDPVVLTLRNEYTAEGPRLGDGLEGLRIIRIGKFSILSRAYLFSKGLFRRNGSASTGTPPHPAGQGQQATATPGSSSMKRLIQSLLFAMPDTERDWIIPAARAAISEVRRNRIDYLFTTCPPYSVHMVGLLVKLATGVRWIADYRDPWIIFGYKRLYPTTPLSIRIEKWMERRVMRSADMITFNVERLRDRYSSHYGAGQEEKFVYLSNGIDIDFFQKYRKMEKSKKFTLAYTGSLYLGRTPEPVFEALKRLIEKGMMKADDVRMKIAGNCRLIGGRPIEEVAGSYGLQGVVELLGPLPYAEALELVARSHVALLFAPAQPYQIPGKLYDYIGSGTSVLAIADEGATTDFIRSNNLGKTFAPDDIDGISRSILESYRRMDESERPPEESISRFYMENVARGLVTEMNRISTGQG